LGLSNRNKNELLEYPGVQMFLKKLARRAGIKKRVNPHSFRHARATHLANFLTEAQMKQYFGWVQGSGMASIYVHLSGRDVDNALLKLNGISTTEDGKKEELLKTVSCPRCQQQNTPVSKFCSRCGSPLVIQTALEMEELRANGDAVINELVKDEQIQEIIVKKIMTNEKFRTRLKSLTD
jgi:ribosomal protein L37E